MLQQCVTQDIALGVETYEHLQVTTESHRGRLHGSTEVVALSVFHLIDGEDHLLALGIVLLHLVSLGNGEVVDAHDRLDTVGQCLLFLFFDGSFRQVVDVGQDATHDNSHEGEHQHHIQ